MSAGFHVTLRYYAELLVSFVILSFLDPLLKSCAGLVNIFGCHDVRCVEGFPTVAGEAVSVSKCCLALVPHFGEKRQPEFTHHEQSVIIKPITTIGLVSNLFDSQQHKT